MLLHAVGDLVRQRERKRLPHIRKPSGGLMLERSGVRESLLMSDGGGLIIALHSSSAPEEAGSNQEEDHYHYDSSPNGGSVDFYHVKPSGLVDFSSLSWISVSRR